MRTIFWLSKLRSCQIGKDKIIALTEDDYRYRFGLLLEISMDKTADVLKWYAEERALYEQRIEFEAWVIDGKTQRSIAF